MAENKTQKTKASVAKYLDAIKDPQKKKDCKKIAAMMYSATGKRAAMWGTAIVGFDEYHYTSDRSAQEGNWPIIGFAPRAANISIYIMDGFTQYDAILKKLGKFKTGSGCLYIKKLDDLDDALLEKLVTKSVAHMRKRYKV